MKNNNLPNSYNWLEIDLAALRSNYQNIQVLVGDSVRVMAIVKSDAYGHGLVPVAQALSREGARIFGVAEVEEGVRLRQAGIAGEVVVLLGAMEGAFQAVVEYDLQVVVFDREMLKTLSEYSASRGHLVGVHLKIDTGMGRLGIMPEQVGAFLWLIDELPGIRLAGVMSHFPRADEQADQDQAVEQNRRFAAILAETGRDGIQRLAHMANSAAIINFPNSHYAMVRPGISMYGYLPCRDRGASGSLSLKPVMSFKTRVVQVKDVPAGHGISYGHTFVTSRPTRLAVLPVGYADGYLRQFSGRAEVIIGGKKVPILGRICMNACMADVTGLEQVRPGDEAVLMGRQGEVVITADDLAGWAETISYEILCLLGGLNQRTYLPD